MKNNYLILMSLLLISISYASVAILNPADGDLVAPGEVNISFMLETTFNETMNCSIIIENEKGIPVIEKYNITELSDGDIGSYIVNITNISEYYIRVSCVAEQKLITYEEETEEKSEIYIGYAKPEIESPKEFEQYLVGETTNIEWQLRTNDLEQYDCRDYLITNNGTVLDNGNSCTMADGDSCQDQIELNDTDTYELIVECYANNGSLAGNSSEIISTGDVAINVEGLEEGEKIDHPLLMFNWTLRTLNDKEYDCTIELDNFDTGYSDIRQETNVTNNSIFTEEFMLPDNGEYSVDIYCEENSGTEGEQIIDFNVNYEKRIYILNPKDGETTNGTLEIKWLIPINVNDDFLCNITIDGNEEITDIITQPFVITDYETYLGAGNHQLEISCYVDPTEWQNIENNINITLENPAYNEQIYVFENTGWGTSIKIIDLNWTIELPTELQGIDWHCYPIYGVEGEPATSIDTYTTWNDNSYQLDISDLVYSHNNSSIPIYWRIVCYWIDGEKYYTAMSDPSCFVALNNTTSINTVNCAGSEWLWNYNLERPDKEILQNGPIQFTGTLVDPLLQIFRNGDDPLDNWGAEPYTEQAFYGDSEINLPFGYYSAYLLNGAPPYRPEDPHFDKSRLISFFINTISSKTVLFSTNSPEIILISPENNTTIETNNSLTNVSFAWTINNSATPQTCNLTIRLDNGTIIDSAEHNVSNGEIINDSFELSEGNYSWNVVCEDIGITSETRYFSIIRNYQPLNIYLIVPLNNTTITINDNSTEVNFQWRIENSSNPVDCNLTINGAYYGTYNSNPGEITSTNIMLSTGTYNWYIICTNESSENWIFHIVQQPINNNTNNSTIIHQTDRDLTVETLFQCPYSLTIIVKDEKTGVGLDNARIEVYYDNGEEVYHTDENGEAQITLKERDFEIKVSDSGYKDYENEYSYQCSLELEVNSYCENEQAYLSIESDGNIEIYSGEELIAQGESGQYSVDEQKEYLVIAEKEGYDSAEQTITTPKCKKEKQTKPPISIGTINYGGSCYQDQGKATITYQDNNGEPIANAYVTVYLNNSTYLTGYTDENGEFIFYGNKGDYEVKIIKEGYEIKKESVSLPDCTVKKKKITEETAEEQQKDKIEKQIEQEEQRFEIKDAIFPIFLLVLIAFVIIFMWKRRKKKTTRE